MKLAVLILTIFLFISCSGNRPADNAVADNPKTEKNKRIALSNEITEATQAAQKLEKQGRDMESFRQWSDAESRRQCSTVMEDRQRQVKVLEDKIKSFPNPFNASLTPIITDLNACVSCSKTAMTSCVKTRASINKAIDEIYRQQ